MKLEELQVYQLSMQIGEKHADRFLSEINNIGVKLNNYIKATK